MLHACVRMRVRVRVCCLLPLLSSPLTCVNCCVVVKTSSIWPIPASITPTWTRSLRKCRMTYSRGASCDRSTQWMQLTGQQSMASWMYSCAEGGGRDADRQWLPKQRMEMGNGKRRNEEE